MMRVASVIALICLIVLSSFNSRGFGRPISLDLHDRHPLAWLLLGCLVVIICLLGRKLRRAGHTVRPVILLSMIPGLVALAVTNSFSAFHHEVFQWLFMGAVLWFVFCTADVFEDFVGGVFFAVFSLIALVVVSSAFDLGGMQKCLIAYAIACANFIYTR